MSEADRRLLKHISLPMRKGAGSMVNHQLPDAVRPNLAGLWSQRPFGTFGGMAAAYSKARRAQCAVAGVSRIDAGSDT